MRNNAIIEGSLSSRSLSSVVAGACGNAIEWYDFALFGYFAPIIAQLFFPSKDHVASLLGTFAAFAVGFIVRPLGGVLFGHIGDKAGRRRALLLSVGMMSVPTVLLGLLPTFVTAGHVSAVLLVFVRIVQGLAVGGEFIGSISLIAEHSPQVRRGLFSSLSMLSCFSGILIGAVAAAAVTNLLNVDRVHAWGWRIPFLFSGILGGVALFMRVRQLEESPHFEHAKKTGRLAESPLRETFGTQKLNLSKVIGLLWVNAVCQYFFFTFFATYVSHFCALTLPEALQISTLSLFLATLLLPLFGWISDMVGRRPVLIAGSVGFTFFTIPLMHMMESANYYEVLLAQLIFAVFLAARSGPIPATLVEVFPTKIRYTALATGYNLTFAIFGGTAPFLATLLIDATGLRAAPGLYLSGVAVISIVVSLLMAETRNKNLRRE